MIPTMIQIPSWTLEVALALAGIVAGYFVSMYFSKKSEAQNLGRYARVGLRLTSDVYQGLDDAIKKIDELKNLPDAGSDDHKSSWPLMLDIIAGRLREIQRSALSSNEQWKDLLPPNQLVKLHTQKQIIGLSDNMDVQFTTEIQHFQPKEK